MADIWNELLSIVRPNGAVASVLAIFCIYLMVQLEHERRCRSRDHTDMLAIVEKTQALLDRVLAKI